MARPRRLSPHLPKAHPFRTVLVMARARAQEVGRGVAAGIRGGRVSRIVRRTEHPRCRAVIGLVA